MERTQNVNIMTKDTQSRQAIKVDAAAADFFFFLSLSLNFIRFPNVLMREYRFWLHVFSMFHVWAVFFLCANAKELIWLHCRFHLEFDLDW